MIRINLLPAEKRKAERTPLPRLTLIMLTAAAATGIVIWVLWILLEIKKTDDEITQATAQLKTYQQKLPEFQALTDKVTKLQAKIQEIDSLTTRDMDDGWWRAINALWDVINAHPRVWIDELRVLNEHSIQTEFKRSDPDSKIVPPYGVTLKCHVAGEDVAEMTKFRNALKAHAIVQETLYNVNINIDWKIDDEKDFDIKNSISFSVTLAGPMTKPKKKGAPPPAGSAAAGAPAPAVGGGGAKGTKKRAPSSRSPASPSSSWRAAGPFTICSS